MGGALDGSPHQINRSAQGTTCDCGIWVCYLMLYLIRRPDDYLLAGLDKSCRRLMTGNRGIIGQMLEANGAWCELQPLIEMQPEDLSPSHPHDYTATPSTSTSSNSVLAGGRNPGGQGNHTSPSSVLVNSPSACGAGARTGGPCDQLRVCSPAPSIAEAKRRSRVRTRSPPRSPPA